jgi:hypothetical protein
MTIGKGKRRRDTNQLAKFIVDATGGQLEIPDHAWSLQDLLRLVKL